MTQIPPHTYSEKFLYMYFPLHTPHIRSQTSPMRHDGRYPDAPQHILPMYHSEESSMSSSYTHSDPGDTLCCTSPIPYPLPILRHHLPYIISSSMTQLPHIYYSKKFPYMYFLIVLYTIYQPTNYTYIHQSSYTSYPTDVILQYPNHHPLIISSPILIPKNPHICIFQNPPLYHTRGTPPITILKKIPYMYFLKYPHICIFYIVRK